MQEAHIYQQIAGVLKREILSGERQPGERLPSIRAMTERWDCTVGTVQRAYRLLADQGLVEARAGRGTRVLAQEKIGQKSPLRQIALDNQLEALFLQALTSGYQLEDLEKAYQRVLDRWRAEPEEQAGPPLAALRFYGSHDLLMTWLAGHMQEIAPGQRLELRYAGSQAGLEAIAAGQADFAGCHLWDAATGEYNAAYVRRALPGRETALVTLAHRNVGWITQPGNPHGFRGLEDLSRQELRFANRQPGSGIRVWLDAQLEAAGIAPAAIRGYADEQPTHTAVARSIAEGVADVGFGLQAAARSFELDFIPDHLERYDLVVPRPVWDQPAFQGIFRWLKSAAGRAVIEAFPGYDAGQSGREAWIN